MRKLNSTGRPQRLMRRAEYSIVRRITATPKKERPRERLNERGPSALCDRELLMILLGTGTRNRDVSSLAEAVLGVVDRRNGDLTIADLKAVDGVGQAKACAVVAALEFARRRHGRRGARVRSAADVLPFVGHFAVRPQEHLICVSLNGAHEVIAARVVTIGLVNASQIHPREVFSDPLTDRAYAIILAHNHPSGVLEPSRQDLAATTRIAEAGKILGIQLLDHVIFSHSGYLSLREENRFKFD